MRGSPAVPMRICQAMLSAGFGGAERLFVDLCRALADAGHEVLAVCHPAFQARFQLNHERISVSPLKVRLDWSPLAQARLRRMIADFKPHIIHCHLARGASVCGSVGRALGVPVAANIHNYVNLKYYRKINHFFPGTEDQRKYLMKNLIIADDISVVPHFTPLAAVESAGIPALKPPRFISYGRFVEKKGFHILFEGLKTIRERGVPAELILGGDGPEKSKLLALIEELGLHQAVSLQGWVDDVATFLAQAPFFILPSLDEPFGIVVLEAMSQGKVLLSSTSQGPSEILDDNTAFLFPPGDAEALANVMEEAAGAGEAARQKAQNALALFKARYALDKVIPIFEGEYKKVIADKWGD